LIARKDNRHLDNKVKHHTRIITSFKEDDIYFEYTSGIESENEIIFVDEENF